METIWRSFATAGSSVIASAVSMASTPLVLPGVLFVGEDDRARIVAHTGPAAGWHVPRGILGWSHEVSVVLRESLTDEIKKTTKLVMPEEQIPPARMPLTAQAAQKSPLVAVSSKLAPKLVELGVRVHTIGVDRVTSSFYYLAEGGGEDQVRIEGDLVQAVGTMLGERADNAAIERVLDGLPDRLLRSLSKDRVSELTVELAAALPRAAADGSGTTDIDLDQFEKDLGKLIGDAEKLQGPAREIANKIAETNDRRLDVPIYGDARKVSQGPFDITVGDRRVSLGTYERWIMSGTAEASPKSVPGASRAGLAPSAEDDMLAGLEAKPSADDAAKKAAEAAAQAKKKADEEAAAKAKKAAEEEAARKKAEADAAAKKRAEEEAAKKKAEADAAAAKAKKAAEEEAAAAAKKAEEEAAAAKAKKAAEEAAAAAAKKAEEEAAAAKAKKAAEEEEAAAAAKAKKAAADEEAEAKAKKAAAADKAAAKSEKAKDESKDEKAQSRVDTVKVKRAEADKPPTTGGSSTMMWVLVLLVIVAAAAYWRFFMNK